MKNIYFAYRSFWPELKTMKKFSEAGINTICFFASNTHNSYGEPYCLYPPIWNFYDKYDFTSLDRQIKDILSASPDAELLCMIDLNTPVWLTKQLAVDSMTQLGYAVNNPAWRKAATNYLKAFLEYSEKKYGDRIKAYILSGGWTSEWQDRTHGDTCDLREAEFKNWLAAMGKTAQRIPEKTNRESTAHDMLRDPQKDALSLDYWHFCNAKTVDTLQHFISETRKLIPAEREIGVFYGYIIELNLKRHISDGYLDYERLIATPGLDFLIGPGTYLDRMTGGGSGFMVPRETLRLKDVQYLHECDQRTHSMNMKISSHIQLEWGKTWNNEQETIAGIKREMALCLISYSSLWWFDMWGGFYQGAKVMNTFKKMKEIWNEYLLPDAKDNTEILLVVDPESSYYFDENDPRIKDFIVGIRNKLNRIGSPYSICSFNDLAHLALDNYKLLIMPNLFVIDADKSKLLREKVLKDNRTVLWFFAPGIINKQQYLPERVRKICGFEYGTKGLQTVALKSWKSAYIHEPGDLSIKMLAALAKEAGVHRYCEAEQTVFSNSELLAIHTAQGGTPKIFLPETCREVIELFSNKSVAKNASEFDYEFKTPDTALFKLEYSAETIFTKEN